MADVIDLFSKVAKASSSRFRLLVDVVTDLVFTDNGTVTGSGSGDSDLESAVGWHFGFYSRPKDGARGVVVKADGQGNTSFLVAFRDRQYEMSLQKGEVGIKNAFDASILLDQSGNVIATAKTGQTVQVNGSDYSLLKTETLLTDLSTLMTHLVAWVPLVVTAVATAPAGAAVDPGVAAQAGTINTNIGNGSYRSTKAKNG